MSRPWLHAVGEFELRRRVFVEARVFFDCDEFELRRAALDELIVAIERYREHQKCAGLLSNKEAT